jgi:TRAP-type mannitol/chloroaromatic compound transport system permease small subunit
MSGHQSRQTDFSRRRSRRALNIVNAIETISEWTGRGTSWLVVGMVALIGYDVAMRYLFKSGSVALQELEWHLFALIFLLGAGYTLKYDDHVRIDIFYRSRWVNARWRAWIDLFGSLFLLSPFCLLVIFSSWPFVHDAYVFGEGSPDPGGLPYRFLLKAAIPVGFSLLLIQGLACGLRSLLVLKGHLPAAHKDAEKS